MDVLRLSTTSVCKALAFAMFIAVVSGTNTLTIEDNNKSVTVITGATGRTGSTLYHQLKDAGHEVRGVIRTVEKARKELGCNACDESEGIFVADVTKPETLRPSLQGATHLVILSASGPRKYPNGTFYFPEGGYPKDIDYLGTKNQVVESAAAGLKQVLMVSSMGTTQPDSFLDLIGNGHALFFKLNGEAALMSSGLSFTIVKPSGLLSEDIEPGNRKLLVGHGDALLESRFRSIPRADVASVLKAAIEMPHLSTNTRFDLSTDPTQPATGDFEALFREARDISVSGTAELQ